MSMRSSWILSKHDRRGQELAPQQPAKEKTALFEKVSNSRFSPPAVRIRLVDVPKRIESANHFMTQHWRRYWAYKKGWQSVLGFMFRSPGSGYVKPQKAIVRITSWRKRILDFDNLVNGCKPILDFLKIAGWIVDDNPQHIEVVISQQRAREDRTTIELLTREAKGTASEQPGPECSGSRSDEARKEQGVSPAGALP